MLLRAAGVCLCLLGLVSPVPARAELRTWIDRDGVYHVEGSAPHKPKRKKAEQPSDAAPEQAPRRSLPSWAQPNQPPRKQRKSASAPAAREPKKRERWWERRSDAPPDEIDRAAELYKIPAELIRAVIAVESAGDASAISHKGAVGLMQLMPQTAGEMYVQDPVDPAQNVQGGTRYLRYLANLFGGDMLLTLAAYNAGPEAVRRFGGVPPYAETRDYVRKVMNAYYDLKRQSMKKLADASTPPSPKGRP
jgi:soluble lytic murein transglycosylase-like protein